MTQQSEKTLNVPPFWICILEAHIHHYAAAYAFCEPASAMQKQTSTTEDARHLIEILVTFPKCTRV